MARPAATDPRRRARGTGRICVAGMRNGRKSVTMDGRWPRPSAAHQDDLAGQQVAQQLARYFFDEVAAGAFAVEQGNLSPQALALQVQPGEPAFQERQLLLQAVASFEPMAAIDAMMREIADEPKARQRHEEPSRPRPAIVPDVAQHGGTPECP